MQASQFKLWTIKMSCKDTLNRRSEKVNRNGDGEKNKWLTSQLVQHQLHATLLSYPPHRFCSGALCPLMGKVSAVYTQDESAPRGNSDQKGFYFLQAPVNKKAGFLGESVGKRKLHWRDWALNQKSSLKPKQPVLERNANQTHEYTHIYPQTIFIID